MNTFSILLKNNLQTLKIADFGSVRKMVPKNMTKKIGTYLYMAPEVFNNSTYTTACDVYSFAITLSEIFTRRKPYGSHIFQTTTQFFSEVGKIVSPLRPELTSNVPAAIATLIQR